MQQYLDLLKNILINGVKKDDRTGVGTLSVFGPQITFDLELGFPLLTTKKLHFKSIAHELLWMLSGDTNIRYLNDNKVTIWNEWADENGDLGPVYGKQWRHWNGAGGKETDQVAALVNELVNNPDSRRHLVSAWNASEIENMALPPCHALWQCYVAGGKMSLKIYQRSADIFLGVPFNIASYALLTHLLAKSCGYKPGQLIWTGGDVHIYMNHLEQARTQLLRSARELPKIILPSQPKDIFSYCYEDIVLENYNPWPHIAAPVAV